MEIIKNLKDSTLTVALVGILDTRTAPVLDEELQKDIENITSLIFDFAKLDYLSSAGLRSLLALQKIMNKQGKMVIKNVNETIMEVFEMTGFVDILNIE